MKDRISEKYLTTYRRKVLTGEEIDAMQEAKPGKVFISIVGVHGIGNKSKLRKAISYAKHTLEQEAYLTKRKSLVNGFANVNGRKPTKNEIRSLMA